MSSRFSAIGVLLQGSGRCGCSGRTRFGSSGDENQVRRVLPPDDDGIARAETRDAPGAGGVLASRDDLAGDVGGDPELRLVAEVRPLVDPSLDARPAVPCRIGGSSRVDAQALGPHRDHDLLAGRGPGLGIRDHPLETESRVRLHDGSPARRLVLHEPPRDRVGDADEVGNEAVDGPLVQVGRLALLLDPAVLHDDDHVAHGQGLLLVVGHVHERDPDLALELLELELHLLAQLEVERAEWLVQQEHGGVVDERAQGRPAAAARPTAPRSAAGRTPTNARARAPRPPGAPRRAC
jgi:hypothetical protein